jgi:hypothetical protein
MQCDGHVCGEGDKLEVQVCENVTQQEFSWVPTDVGGRLKVADKNLCFQHINRTMYRLEVCSSSEKQVLVGFSASAPFELYPHKLVGKRCFSSQHHPKASEEVMIYRCSAARAAHANFWEVYWPSMGGGGIVVTQPDLLKETAPQHIWSPPSDHAQVRIRVENAKATVILIHIARAILFASKRTKMYQFLDVAERTTPERIIALTRRIFKRRTKDWL